MHRCAALQQSLFWRQFSFSEEQGQELPLHEPPQQGGVGSNRQLAPRPLQLGLATHWPARHRPSMGTWAVEQKLSSGTFWNWQPELGSHESVVQGLSSLQVRGEPAVQVPFASQVSPTVHWLPSSHVAPAVTASMHVPVVSTQSGS